MLLVHSTLLAANTVFYFHGLDSIPGRPIHKGLGTLWSSNATGYISVDLGHNLPVKKNRQHGSQILAFSAEGLRVLGYNVLNFCASYARRHQSVWD